MTWMWLNFILMFLSWTNLSMIALYCCSALASMAHLYLSLTQAHSQFSQSLLNWCHFFFLVPWLLSLNFLAVFIVYAYMVTAATFVIKILRFTLVNCCFKKLDSFATKSINCFVVSNLDFAIFLERS